MNPDYDTLTQLFLFELEPAVWSFSLLEQLAHEANRLNAIIDVHVEFDTGMARLGFAAHEIDKVLTTFKTYTRLRPSSIFTHLACADDPSSDEYTLKQLTLFYELTKKFKINYPYILSHALNTSGVIRFSQYKTDIARLGIGLYGISPMNEMRDELIEIGGLYSTISQIHEYEKGVSVGYNRRTILTRNSRIATVPIGYADGISRKLGLGKFHFWTRGKACPTVGSICMDMTMLDVTDVPEAQEHDEVAIFGYSNERFQSIQALAEALETIPYEILTGISARVRRIYVNE